LPKGVTQTGRQLTTLYEFENSARSKHLNMAGPQASRINGSNLNISLRKENKSKNYLPKEGLADHAVERYELQTHIASD
jgi:hypothetical protein